MEAGVREQVVARGRTGRRARNANTAFCRRTARRRRRHVLLVARPRRRTTSPVESRRGLDMVKASVNSW